MITLVLAVLGLIFGSFVNALVWRLHAGRDWVRERSECTHCHHQLAARDLIPVFSWLVLRGKCRYCGKKIDDTPLVEIATALLFVLSYLFWPVALEGAGLFRFVIWLALAIGLMALAVYDLRWLLLPDKLVFPLVGLAVLQLAVVSIWYRGGWHAGFSAAVSALIISGSFYILFQTSKGRWIGGGDVKLGVVLGLLAGDPLKSLLLLFAASVSGTVASLPLLFTGKANRKSQIPFGPFLIFGLIIVQLFGASILNWYSQHLVL